MIPNLTLQVTDQENCHFQCNHNLAQQPRFMEIESKLILGTLREALPIHHFHLCFSCGAIVNGMEINQLHDLKRDQNNYNKSDVVGHKTST